ncbi:MAG: SpoIIE family protein phosphatase, partial [Desulfobacterales bacterium]|nr:SpoIIE family protein phosphatase [Desulfobacterales bacterium]
SWQVLFLFFLPRLVLILAISYLSVIVCMKQLLKPVSACLKKIRNKEDLPAEEVEAAQKRILNLPYLHFPLNIAIWIFIPSIVALAAVVSGMTNYQTAAILSIRAGMVGLIASAIASQRIESISRTALIPFFFPDGQLTRLKTVSRLSLSRRIVFINRLGAVIPILILLITLLTLQWQVALEPIPALDYGRGIIIFVSVLFAWTLLFSRELNRMLSKNIVDPINRMVEVLRHVRKGEYTRRLQVVTNDEIGYAGDVVNEMAQGLEEREKMQRSLNLARQIQQNLLPKENPDVPGLDIAGSSIYCDETGGDYYDFLLPDHPADPSVRIVLGDVSGHGISSALLMTTSRALFRQRSVMPGELSEVVSQVNRLLCEDVGDSGNFMTLFCAEVDPVNHRIKWVRAGHDPAILYHADTDRFSELKGPGMALGVDKNMVYEARQVSSLSGGQVAVLYTDGVWEAKDADGQAFGKDRLKQVIRENSNLPAQKILDAVMDASIQFQKGEKRQDDATLIIIKFL